MKLVHLVGFIINKFGTMHGHTNVKLPQGVFSGISLRRPVWTSAENLAPTGIRSADRPARSELLYGLIYSSPLWEPYTNNSLSLPDNTADKGSSLLRYYTVSDGLTVNNYRRLQRA